MLRRSDSGESDRRLTVFTSEYGKLDLIAKGARKGGSRLAGISEPLTLAKMHFAIGRQRRFITQVEPVTSFPGVRAEYSRLLCGLAWLEVVTLALPYESPAPDVFELSERVVSELGGKGEPLAVLAWGLSQLLVLEGQSPDWMACMASGERIRFDPAWVSAAAGGAVSGEHAGRYPDARLTSSEILIALNRLPDLDSPPRQIRHLSDVVTILYVFWHSVLERPLPAMLAAIRESESAGE